MSSTNCFMSAACRVASASPASALDGARENQLQCGRERVQEISQVVHHAAGDLHARFVKIVSHSRCFSVNSWFERSRLPVYSSIFRSPLGDDFPDGRNGDETQGIIDQPAR